MPKQVYDALKVILDEFGENDLEPRLDWFAGQDFGRQLLRAFNLVQAWSSNPALTADDIRDCLKEADDDWKQEWQADEAA
jgi:hypothetical protein